VFEAHVGWGPLFFGTGFLTTFFTLFDSRIPKIKVIAVLGVRSEGIRDALSDDISCSN